jgi:hypothetical protein
LKFQREQLGDIIPEVMPMLVDHYEELTLNKEVVKLLPKWDEYAALEAMGRFVVFTARDDSGALVAYNAFFLNPHMHYSDLTVAANDVFYIRHENRAGHFALRFLRYTETALAGLGARKVAYHFKHGNNFAAILRHLDYQDEEGVAGKII